MRCRGRRVRALLVGNGRRRWHVGYWRRDGLRHVLDCVFDSVATGRRRRRFGVGARARQNEHHESNQEQEKEGEKEDTAREYRTDQSQLLRLVAGTRAQKGGAPPHEFECEHDPLRVELAKVAGAPPKFGGADVDRRSTPALTGDAGQRVRHRSGALRLSMHIVSTAADPELRPGMSISPGG
jgi:hypothetical protein